MVKIDNLILRRYEGKKCIGFTYDLVLDDKTGESIEMQFRRSNGDSSLWTMSACFAKTAYAESQLYELVIESYKESMPLERIAEFGLSGIKEYLNAEMSKKQEIVFQINEVLR